VTRAQWLEARRRGLGGSDVAAVLGLSPFRTAWDVWVEKRGLDLEAEDSADKRRGRRLERAVLEWAAEDAGLELYVPPPYTLEQGPEPWALATADALLIDRPAPRGLEAKTARTTDGFGEHGSDVVPLHYALQCHWYMHCYDVPRWDLAAFFTLTDDWRRFELHRDATIEKNLVRRLGHWWQHHVVEAHPPPIDGSPGVDVWLRARFPFELDDARAATPDEELLVRMLHSSRSIKRAYDDGIATLTQQIEAAIGDHSGIHFAGGRATWRNEVRRRIDVEALAAAHPEIAERFRVATPHRVLRTSVQPPA
jgi:putative phage-type endonuclease